MMYPFYFLENSMLFAIAFKLKDNGFSNELSAFIARNKWEMMMEYHEKIQYLKYASGE